MPFIQKLFSTYQDYADQEVRIGEKNRIWYDSISNTFRLSDGVTPGGIPIGGGSGGSSYVLPTATSSVLGGVKIGNNITITNGVISVAAPFSGSYTDLTNKPTIPAAQVNSDWNAVSGVAQILNKPTIPTVPTNVSAFTNDSGYLTSVAWNSITGKPTFATVATTGSYNDLSNTPTIPAAQVNSDWNAVSGVAQILNKPTIPTNTNQLTNGSGYITTGSLSVTTTTASSGGSLVYSNGVFTFAPADVSNVTSIPAATFEPMGHADKTQSNISFNNSTRTFTISPVSTSYDVWVKGVKFTISTTLTVTIPNTTGLYYIYFDTTGTLTYQTSFFSFNTECMTAYVYWNSVTGKAPFVADERHGITLDWATHEYLHRTRGAAIANGFGASNYIVGGDGSNLNQLRIDIASGTFFDEDLRVDVVSTNTPVANTWQQDLSSPTQIPMFYLSGTGWVMDNPTTEIVKQGTTYPTYNLNTAGTWTTPDLSQGRFGVTWIIATNNINYPVMGILGQQAYLTENAADADTWANLTLTNFPIVEFRPLYKVVYLCKASFTNADKASITAVWDLRSFNSVVQAAASYVDANALSGTTLAAGVVNSSLTSVGTLTSGAIGTGFTAIPNSALVNSSVTFNSTSVALGSSGTISTLVNGSFTASLTSVGQLQLPVITQSTYTGGTLVATGNILMNANGNVWQFGSDGTMSSPYSVGITTTGFKIPASGNGSVSLNAAATASNYTITFPARTGTVITTADSATVTNTMLASSSVTVNGTAISLGGSGTVTAAAGTLTGTTLNSTVVSSSLTSVGTLSSLAVTSTSTSASNVLAITGVVSAPHGSTATWNFQTEGSNLGSYNSRIQFPDSTYQYTAWTGTAAAGTLTGSALNPTVTISSLTTVGTINTGIWQGTAIDKSYLAQNTITVNGTSIQLGATATITAAAGSLTGGTLNSTVTASSLTSVGTLTSLSVNGTITQTLTGNGSNVATQISATATKGGANYADVLQFTNTTSGATNINKFIRLNSTGGLEILNSAYTAALFSISDAGQLSIGGAASSSNDPTTNWLSFNSNGTAIYDDGNTHIHSRNSGGAMWINTNNGIIALGNQSVVNGGSAASGITMGNSTTVKAYLSVYSGKTYTIGSYGYTAQGGTGTGGGTTASYGIYSDNRMQAVEFDATSDERLKDIQGVIPLDQAIKFVTSVDGILYTWREGAGDPGLKSGFSAQGVHKAGFDHMVGHMPNENLVGDEDEDGWVHPDKMQLSVGYNQAIPYHHEVIKHLLAEIDSLKTQVAELQKR